MAIWLRYNLSLTLSMLNIYARLRPLSLPTMKNIRITIFANEFTKIMFAKNKHEFSSLKGLLTVNK